MTSAGKASTYQFPPTRFTANTLWRQWWHLLSEVLEVGRALLRGDYQHAAAEVWDVKQSSETLHRILAAHDVDIEIKQHQVFIGCLVRGYYDEDPE